MKSQNADDFDFHLLTNFVSLARKQKSDAEYVLAEFMKLQSDERYVGAIASLNLITNHTTIIRASMLASFTVPLRLLSCSNKRLRHETSLSVLPRTLGSTQ